MQKMNFVVEVLIFEQNAVGDDRVTTPMGAFVARKKEQVENDEEVEGDKHTNANESLNLRNRVGDNGGSEPTKTMIGPVRANADDEKEKDSSK